MSEPAPGRDLVLFDGVCVLCDRSVRFLLRIDRRRRLLFAPLQGPTAAGVQARHGLSGDLGTLVLVRDHGTGDERVLVRSSGALAVLSAIGGIWRLFSALRAVPRPIRDAIYDWVAAHRYAWFGRYDACRLPAPGERERFLD